ncbi:SDR family NAD(P)-dependent oxidoreductase [Niabella digestorum]|uniref:SDR family NAD(P)-dependent oxidoreductase n=1 Tax=Niabella digestorum TaxID=3117701 RepID=A0ABU7RI86_9BACT
MSYALVTGAAKGIGAAIAIELAKLKKGLILVDVDERSLHEVAQYIQDKYYGDVFPIVQDLSQPDAAQQIFEKTKWYHLYLNIVVNNAGFGLNTPFTEGSLDDQLNIIDVNVKAQLRIVHTFVPVLKRFSESYLLNVGSTTCYQSVPYLSVYAASKAFVRSFTRSLRYELKDSTVSVSCLIPGPTDTAFVERAGMKTHTLKTAAKFNMTPQEVAQVAVKGLFKGKAEIVPGFINKLNAVVTKFVPPRIVEHVAAQIYKPRPGEQEDKKAVALQY